MMLLCQAVREYLLDKHDNWSVHESAFRTESIFIFPKEIMSVVGPYICIDTGALMVYLYAGVLDDCLASIQYTEATILQHVTSMIHQAESIINNV